MKKTQSNTKCDTGKSEAKSDLQKKKTCDTTKNKNKCDK